MILLGSFSSVTFTHPWYSILAATGVILAAVYMLWMVRRFLFGELNLKFKDKIQDIKFIQYAPLLPLVLFMVWIGVYPTPFFKLSEKAIEKLLSNTREKIMLIDYKDQFGYNPAKKVKLTDVELNQCFIYEHPSP